MGRRARISIYLAPLGLVAVGAVLSSLADDCGDMLDRRCPPELASEAAAIAFVAGVVAAAAAVVTALLWTAFWRGDERSSDR